MGVPHQIHTYAELRKQIHDDLRIQHPEWIYPDGSSPVCDSYEVRLMETLAALQREDNRPIMAVSRRSVRQQENSRASLTF